MFQPFSIDQYHNIIDSVLPIRASGRVKKVVGMVIEASCPASQIGCVCDIVTEGGAGVVSAEILGFKEDSVLLMPLEDVRTLGPGCKVVARGFEHLQGASKTPNPL